MSFFTDSRTLRSGKTYNQSLHPKMSVNAEIPVKQDIFSYTYLKGPKNGQWVRHWHVSTLMVITAADATE